MNKQMELCFNQKKKQKKTKQKAKEKESIFDPLVKSLNVTLSTSLCMFHPIFFQSTLFCSRFIIISFSPHFLVHVLLLFLQSTLHCSCFIVISFSPQSIPFTYHISLIWLYSYYMVIQPHGQFHFSANPVYGN